MPVFFQQQINEYTRLGVWKIEETEEFFKYNVPLHRDVTHPHKRLQHLAGRFLLQFIFPDFPYELIQIADTKKPFLPDEQYHFSISHCGDYAAAIVSRKSRVGVDVEIPQAKVLKIADKFLSPLEKEMFNIQYSMFNDKVEREIGAATLCWSVKEAIFKWYGDGAVDFKKDINLLKRAEDESYVECFFSKTQSTLTVHYRHLDNLVLTWIISELAEDNHIDT